MESIQKSIDPRILGEILVRRKWYLIVPFLITVTVGAIITEGMVEVYRVQSRVLYEDRSPLARNIEQRLLPGSQETGRKRREDRVEEARVLREKVLSEDFLVDIANEMSIMDDPGIFTRAAEMKETTGDPSSVEQIARQNISGWLKSMINITLSGSNIYRISTEGQDPKLIFELAKLINSKLQDASQANELDRINAASSFTSQQIQIYQQKTDKARRDLRNYLSYLSDAGRQGTDQVNVDRGEAARLAQETGFEIDRLSERIESNRTTLARSYSIDLEQFVAELPEAVIESRGRLDNMEKQLGYLLLERSWSDPTVITQNGRIGEARREIEGLIDSRAASVLSDRSPFVRQLVGEGARDIILLSTLETRRTTFTAHSIGTSGPDTALLARREERREYLEEQVRTNEELLRSFNDQAASTSITAAVEKDDEIRSIRVIESPKWPTRPISPNKVQLYAVAILAGIGFGGVFMVLREYLDNSIRDVHEAEEIMGVPTLGTIPKIDFAGLPGSQTKLRKSIVYAVLGVIVAGAAVSYYLYAGDGRESAGEEENVETSTIETRHLPETIGA